MEKMDVWSTEKDFGQVPANNLDSHSRIWIGKICIFVTMINSQDKILQKTERMIYFHIMFMSASSIKRKSTLLLREATRSFIFRSATTFPGRKHLKENAFLGFRFEMLIRK